MNENETYSSYPADTLPISVHGVDAGTEDALAGDILFTDVSGNDIAPAVYSQTGNVSGGDAVTVIPADTVQNSAALLVSIDYKLSAVIFILLFAVCRPMIRNFVRGFTGRNNIDK